MGPFDGHLRSIARNDDVMTQERRADKAAAVDAFRAHPAPHIGYSYKRAGCIENILRTVPQAFAPVFKFVGVGS